MQYFFGNKDITILQELAKRSFQGKLNGMILITTEKDIELSSVFDYEGIKDIEETHSDAPNLIKNLKNAFTQKDKNKNLIKPTVIYFAGVSSNTNTTKIEQILEDKKYLFYGVSILETTQELLKWAAAYPKNMIFYFNTKTKIDIEEGGKSNKIRLFLDKKDEGFHTMELVKFLWSNTFDGVKFMEFVGATPDNLTDGEVEELDKAGIVTYRSVNGEGEVTSSLTTDGKSHIDTVYVIDTVKYLLANNLHKMFKENAVNTSSVTGLVNIYSRKALDFAFNDLKMIEKDENNTPKYTIYIPEITGDIRDIRGLKGIVWKFIPNVPIEQINGTVTEVFSEIELTVNDLGGI